MIRSCARGLRWTLPTLLLAAAPAWGQSVAVTTTSADARALFEEGRAALGNVDFDVALARLDAAVERDPTFVLAHLYRASLSPASERDRHMEAVRAHLAHASDGERELVESYQARLEGDHAREIDVLADLAGRYPDDKDVHHLLGIRYYGAERYDEAAAAFRRSLQIDPAFGGAHNMLGYVALAQGDLARAEDELQAYRRLVPDHANPYDSLGELYVRTGRYDEAIPLLERALELNPAFDAAENNLAWAHIGTSNERFERTFAAKDAAGMAAFYFPTGSLLPTGSEPVQGTEAIAEFWQGAFDTGLAGVDLETEEVYAEGDMAVEVGRYTLTTAGGQTADRGKYIVVWGREDGEWKMYRDIWNSSLSPVAAQN